VIVVSFLQTGALQLFARGRSGIIGGNIRDHARSGFFHQQSFALWSRARHCIVVDDAIVVVENVERNMRLVIRHRCTKRAMSEVTGPIVATALVLCAVFVPTAFISGLYGPIYKHCHHYCDFYGHSRLSLTYLSPALCAVLLKDSFTRPRIPSAA